MTTLDNATVAAPVLRRLYFVRVGFAVVWAVLLGVTASDLGVAAGVLLVIYPLFDVAAAVVDFRSSQARELVLNIGISSLAAVGGRLREQRPPARSSVRARATSCTAAAFVCRG